MCLVKESPSRRPKGTDGSSSRSPNRSSLNGPVRVAYLLGNCVREKQGHDDEAVKVAEAPRAAARSWRSLQIWWAGGGQTKAGSVWNGHKNPTGKAGKPDKVTGPSGRRNGRQEGAGSKRGKRAMTRQECAVLVYTACCQLDLKRTRCYHFRAGSLSQRSPRAGVCTHVFLSLWPSSPPLWLPSTRKLADLPIVYVPNSHGHSLSAYIVF
ncbi:unnamed protein product [Protopolystoma xenopodis]|uniref:Uncharacterized protein n=1 Tax=Protopolystoma xenopodis TaxID=117903 RepID=A0A448XIX3_9PLAT|nr:unnamed protein product [Protopolystoma xenopodis]